MAWVVENEVKGQEAYRMDNVGDHRKVDTRAQNPQDVDGAEPDLPAAEWVRTTDADLDERYGKRAASKSVDGKY